MQINYNLLCINKLYLQDFKINAKTLKSVINPRKKNIK